RAVARVGVSAPGSIADDIRRQVLGVHTEIVRFGVEIDPPAPDGRSNWRRRLGIDDQAFVALSSRLIRPNYNIDTIIEAFSVVRRRVPESVLVLKEHEPFSDPDYRQRCFDLLAELG